MKFLSTPLGSWLKVFISTVLTLWLAELSSGHDLFSFDIALLKKILAAAIVSTLPTLINWINPADTRYGTNKQA